MWQLLSSRVSADVSRAEVGQLQPFCDQQNNTSKSAKVNFAFNLQQTSNYADGRMEQRGSQVSPNEAVNSSEE